MHSLRVENTQGLNECDEFRRFKRAESEGVKDLSEAATGRH